MKYLGLIILWFFTVILFSFTLKIYSDTKSPKPITLISTPTPVSKFISQISHGSRQLPEIALTFDADMTPKMVKELETGQIRSYYNQAITEILNKEQIPATIFISGLWAKRYPEITKELSQNPLFEIGNHSYSHPRFTNKCYALPPVPEWGKDAEFQLSQEALKNIIGFYPQLFRFPGGCHSPQDVELANQYRLTVVDWDASSGDSFNPNLNSVVSNIKKYTQNGSILLFHLNGNKNAPKTAQALELIIPYLRQKNFQFVTVSRLISTLN